jgi:hypothetical protein
VRGIAEGLGEVLSRLLEGWLEAHGFAEFGDGCFEVVLRYSVAGSLGTLIGICR